MILSSKILPSSPSDSCTSVLETITINAGVIKIVMTHDHGKAFYFISVETIFIKHIKNVLFMLLAAFDVSQRIGRHSGDI